MTKICWSVFTGLFTFCRALSSGYINSALFENVVVIPDVHGDDFAALTSLWKAFIQIENIDIDLNEFYTRMQEGRNILLSPNPTRTLVVQLGDLVDRGPNTVFCFDIFEAIPKVIGWQTLVLYGNHELASMVHRFEQFVHPLDYDLFGGVDARKAAFAYPTGSLFTRMTRSFLAMAKVVSPVSYLDPRSASTLFVHGGIDLDWFSRYSALFDIDAFNSQVQQWITEPDPVLQATNMAKLLDLSSPVWTRTFEEMTEEALCGPYLDAILTRFEVARIIVGHNPQDSFHARSRCGGRILLIDVRMSRWMHSPDPDVKHGHPVAVILRIAPDGSLISLESQATDLAYRMMDEITDLTSVAPTPNKLFMRRNSSSSLAITSSPISVLAGVQSPVNIARPLTLFRKMQTGVYFAQLGTSRGIVQIYPEAPKNSEAIARLYRSYPSGIPAVLDEGVIPVSKLRLNTFASKPTSPIAYYRFFETRAKMTLWDLFLAMGQPACIPQPIPKEIIDIVKHLHDEDLLLGLKPVSNPQEMFLRKFGFDPDAEIVHVQLIDLTDVVLSTDEEEIDDEQFMLSMDIPALGQREESDNPSVDNDDIQDDLESLDQSHHGNYGRGCALVASKPTVFVGANLVVEGDDDVGDFF